MCREIESLALEEREWERSMVMREFEGEKRMRVKILWSVVFVSQRGLVCVVIAYLRSGRYLYQVTQHVSVK